MADTIFAVASGAGRAAIAVIRVSGPTAGEALTALAGPLPSPRVATLRALRDPGDATPLDRALVLWLPGPASATGEDTAELHLHGGRAVVAAVLAALGRCPGCRMAAPGEFTRRSFLNGRMDLGEVEGLADLIDAETDAQRRQAMRQMEGGLAAWVAAQRPRLVAAMAAAESAIDFSDEGDVAGDFSREVVACAAALRGAVQAQLRTAAVASRVRDGFVLALCGPPNAGKSTLLNALVQRDVAIVSPQPGTTRDTIEVHLDLGGFLVQVVDTAGLRPTTDAIEREGVARARARAGSADLILWLADVRAPSLPDPAFAGRPLWRVATKIDVAPDEHPQGFDHAISAATGAGLASLLDRVQALLEGSGPGHDGVVTRQRHRAALERAEALLAAIVDAGAMVPMELAAERLKAVASELDGLLGRVSSEEVLDAIFARFCIGK